MIRKIVGVTFISLFLSIMIGGTVYFCGLEAAIQAWGFSLAMTSMVVYGLYLLIW